MSKSNKTLPTAAELKERFREGASPLQSDFAALIDMAELGVEAAKMVPPEGPLGQGLRKGKTGLLEIDCKQHDFAQNPTAGGSLPLVIDAVSNTPCIELHNGLASTEAGLTVKAGTGIQVDEQGIHVDPDYLIPQGIIVMWSGAEKNIPAGWQLCNGENGTPELTDRFIVGRGNIYSGTGGSTQGTTGPTSPGGIVKVEPHALTIDELPEHSHELKTIELSIDSPPPEKGFMYSSDIEENTKDFKNNTRSVNPAGKGKAHSHAATFTPKPHTHSFEFSPPWFALAFIMKIS